MRLAPLLLPHAPSLLRLPRFGTFIDVRPVEECRACQIPRTHSIPIIELAERLLALPKDREIVVFCRGPFCVMAVEAVDLLGSRGFAAHRTEQVVAAWRARGGRTATGPRARRPRGAGAPK